MAGKCQFIPTTGPHRDRIAALMDDGQTRTAIEIHALLPDIRLKIISSTLQRMTDAGELVKSGSNRSVTYRLAEDVPVTVETGPVEDGFALARAWRSVAGRGRHA